jgi:hypothetical protein
MEDENFLLWLDLGGFLHFKEQAGSLLSAPSFPDVSQGHPSEMTSGLYLKPGPWGWWECCKFF